MPKINLSDTGLFGNEAAEHEDEAVFLSYAFERPELARSLDHNNGIHIYRAYKGEGKSALLRLVALRAQKSDPLSLIIKTSGSSLSPSLTGASSDAWVRAWKENILRLVTREIGATIAFAATDDAITLVEESEAGGFKGRSFVSSITDRLSSKSVPIERQRRGVIDPEQTLKRWKGALRFSLVAGSADRPSLA